MFSVLQIDMEDDIHKFTEDVFQISEKEKSDQVTIELELKELIEENEKIKIVLTYNKKPFKEIIITRRNHD